MNEGFHPTCSTSVEEKHEQLQAKRTSRCPAQLSPRGTPKVVLSNPNALVLPSSSRVAQDASRTGYALQNRIKDYGDWFAGATGEWSELN
jgi:hypothetical protein